MEYLEQAIHHYQQALEVYTREDFPEQWATTQNNLGEAYTERVRGNRAENVEQAIHHLLQALEVRMRQDFPEQWATTQNNLGEAYRQRIRGDRVENLERAVHHYQQALEIRTATAFPRDCRDTAYALGNLLYDERRVTEARAAFTTALEAVEALRAEIRREGAKRDLAEQNALLYAHLVHCCLLENDEASAFEYAMAGKGWAFVDLLATARFDLSGAGAKNPELAVDLHQARDLRQQIDNLLAQLVVDSGPSAPDGTERRSPLEMRTNLRALYEQEAALWEEMSFKYPALTATQQAPILTADKTRALAKDLESTLVEYYQHADGWCAFVVTPNNVRHVPLPGIDDSLLNAVSKWLKWIESPKARNELSYIPLRRLHQALIAPLRPYLPLGEAVVLAPFAWLHLVPLGAALDPDTSRYASEDYRLAYAPSLPALQVMLRVMREQAQRRATFIEQKPERLLSVAYPGVPGTETYLPNVLPEAEAIARHFSQVTPLYEEAATPETVLAHARGKDVIHLSCHGWFDPEAPEQSGLMLSGGWLTVQRIVIEMHLEQARLVTVSASLSGRVDVRRGEEHVGLLQALMSAGARAVVTSLWAVDEVATRVFFEAFYAEVAAGSSPADALTEAAQQVRSYPGWEHPYYWAAFQVTGLAHTSAENLYMRMQQQAAGIYNSMIKIPRSLAEAFRSLSGADVLRSSGVVEHQSTLIFQAAKQGDAMSARREYVLKHVPGHINEVPPPDPTDAEILPKYPLE